MNILKRSLDRSMEYLRRAEKVIPSVTQCLSKGPIQYVGGVAPVYLVSGKGSHVFDIDGNEYIDYVSALGAVILGYAYARVDEAIIQQLRKGISFSLMHPLEVELSELLTEIIPCAEMVRFSKSGSTAMTAAIKAARAYTGREKVAQGGYHGWQDWSICTSTRTKGVPKQTKNLTLTYKYNEIETLENIFSNNRDKIAAVTLEPIELEAPKKGFLKQVQKLTYENGAVLIFDEVVTGFRMALGGAQEFFDVTPDLACFGKAMANGMPLAALVGKTEIMKTFEEAFFSSTFGGETLSLAASLATINEIKEKRVINYIWKQGNRIKEGFNKLAKEFNVEEYAVCEGWGPRTVGLFTGEKGKKSLALKSLFQQEVIKRGILWMYHLISFSHSDEDIERTLEVYADAFPVIQKAISEGDIEKYLEGTKIGSVF